VDNNPDKRREANCQLKASNMDARLKHIKHTYIYKTTQVHAHYSTHLHVHQVKVLQLAYLYCIMCVKRRNGFNGTHVAIKTSIVRRHRFNPFYTTSMIYQTKKQRIAAKSSKTSATNAQTCKILIIKPKIVNRR
jgi:hypothetical protein